MKVAYILSMAKSGIPHWTYREIDILSQDGVEIYAFPLKWTAGPHMPKPDWHFSRPNKLRILASQPPAFLARPLRYAQLLWLAVRMGCILEFLMAADFSLKMRRAAVTHIHCHFGDRKFYTGYFCSRMLDLPLSVTVHAYEILMNPNPAMFKLAAERAKCIVVQSEFNKREVMRVFGVPEEKLRIIHAHGDVCDERLRTSVKILMVGEFREKKGHEIFLKALRKLQRDDLTAWIVGRGRLDVPRMAEELGVSHQTIFFGEVGKDMLYTLYNACDFLVQPSRTAPNGDREGLPAVLIEAMSHHKPVISTRHAAIPELVPEILVDENDVDGLAEAIARLADNPELRAEMGERNHRIVKEQYSTPAVLALKEVFSDSEQAM